MADIGIVPKGRGFGTSPCVSRGKLDRDAREQRGPDSLWVTHCPFQPPKVKVRMGYVCRTRLFFSWVWFIPFPFMGTGYILGNITKYFLICKMELIAHLSQGFS